MSATTNTATINVPAGKIYTIKAVGECYVDLVSGQLGAGYTAVRLVNKSQDFGPYGADSVLAVRVVSGTVTYGENGGAQTAAVGAPLTLTLTESQGVTLVGATGATGTIQRYNSAGTLIDTRAISAGALPSIGAYAGGQTVVITPTAASIDATVVAAVLGALRGATLPDGDGVALYDVAISPISGGVYPISSATAAFSAADVGKICSFWQGSVGTYKGYGTIASVQSPTSASLALTVNGTAIPGGGITNAVMVYGTDMLSATQAAISAAKPLGSSVMGRGIICLSGQLVIPDNFVLNGPGRISGFDLPQNLKYTRSIFVLCGQVATTGGFVQLGDNSGGGSPRLYGVNTDAMLQADFAIKMVYGAPKMIECMSIRARDQVGNGAVVKMSSGGLLQDSVTVSHNTSHGILVDTAADCHIFGGASFGAGAARYSLKLANTIDTEVMRVHMWKSSDLSLSGSQVRIESYTIGPTLGTINTSVKACRFDTSFGPHVDIFAFAGCTLAAIDVSGNVGFNNDAVPANINPFMKIGGGLGSFIRGMTINGNTGNSSFSDETKGTYTAFIAGDTTIPSLRAVSVGGNAMNNCAAGYTGGFTPNYSGGNVFVPQGSGATTTF